MGLLLFAAFGAFFVAGAVIPGDDPADRWMRPMFAALAAVMFGFVAGVGLQLTGLVPAGLRPTLDETADDLTMVPQQPGRAAFGMGPVGAAWLVATLIVTLAPAGVAPLVIVAVFWLGTGAFLVLMLASIRWRMSAGRIEQRIDYRIFAYTDHIERVDELSFQENKNWLWVAGPATRTWTVFGRPGRPAPRARTVIVLAELPEMSPGELAAAIERHTGQPILLGPPPGQFG
ncbi:hypothetical protein GOHSU_14_00520 [Gordonia hirsuta DSM 44140 = NBRC 16056]|uniref:Uncharacterized protein n=2 Tax=Gordonia hirsuta TaxID=53427 RepID=L7L6V8_9ACTN|nr:hypothetical protein GOHSU_14_00520 [Gordonia hirsuta DSM 44140 = NBRC 16056]